MTKEGKIRYDANEFRDPFVLFNTRHPDTYSNEGLQDIKSCLDRIYGPTEINLGDFPPRPTFWALFDSVDFALGFEQFYCAKFEDGGTTKNLEKEIRSDYDKLEKIPSKSGAIPSLVTGVASGILGAFIGSEYDRPILGAVIGSTIGTVGSIVAGRSIFENAQKSYAALKKKLDVPMDQALENMRTREFAQQEKDLQKLVFETIRDYGY